MPKVSDKHHRVRGGKPRDLYNDFDSEQREGLEDPLSEPMRPAFKGHPRERDFEPRSRELHARPRHGRA